MAPNRIGAACAATFSLLVLVLAIAFVAVVVNAGAKPVGAQPFAVKTTSVTQDDQQLVWSVTLEHRFAPGELSSGGRSLCLLIERAKGGVSGVVCVAPGSKKGGAARLVYEHVSRAGRGPAQAVGGAISRTGGNDLTARFALTGIGDTKYQPIHWQVLSTLSAPACKPHGCRTVFPAKPQLVNVHQPQPVGCTATGAPYVTNGPSDRHEIAFTFDDGPWYDTPQFLDILEKYDVHATFFQIGDQIGEYGGAVDKRMLADGDMIGDHTWNHPDVAGAGSFARGEIEQDADAIRGLTGFTPCLFRAPYGDTSPALIAEARSLGFTTIQWDIDPRDWARPGVGAIVSNVLDNAHNGAIIIQHDGGGDRSETLAALPQEITALRKRGYQFVTITQLLGQKLIYK
jgi:peptidoglycan/xylan/chitin deacetylase (PgdA/CDA1 family)